MEIGRKTAMQTGLASGPPPVPSCGSPVPVRSRWRKSGTFQHM